MSDDPTKLCHPGECRDCEARRARATEQLLDEHAHLLDSIVIVKEPPPQLFAVPQFTDEQRQQLQARITETVRGIQAAFEAMARAMENAAKGFASVRAALEEHRGGNAEDCPACHDTNPPYPFICPGNAPKEPTS